jgi:hypothetical protein
LPFIWSEANGMVAIPLASGTSLGQAQGVNSAGWVVGTDGGAFAVPFLYDGTNTYRLQDLIPANSGWDLSMNTSSSAMAISENNIIVGTGVHNGDTHAYAMVPVAPTPYSHTDAECNSDTNADSYCYCHCDTYRYAPGYTEAASDSAPAA